MFMTKKKLKYILGKSKYIFMQLEKQYSENRKLRLAKNKRFFRKT